MAALSLANAVLGEKEAALQEAQRAIMLLPSIKDRVWGPIFEENLAVIQMMVGENSRAISTLTRLLQTPYTGWTYGFGRTPVTAALLRLDPHWDPLRSDPRFPKTLRGKAALKTLIKESLDGADTLDSWRSGLMELAGVSQSLHRR